MAVWRGQINHCLLLSLKLVCLTPVERRGRIVHWLTKGEGKVCSAVCELLIFRYALELV